MIYEDEDKKVFPIHRKMEINYARAEFNFGSCFVKTLRSDVNSLLVIAVAGCEAEVYVFTRN